MRKDDWKWNEMRQVGTDYTEPDASIPLAGKLGIQLHSGGKAVVQVRTPGGLGSGFIINEDGFLMTNFHVIEGETQISVEVYHQRDGQLERKSYKQVRIIALNKFADLALLKVDDKEIALNAFTQEFMGNVAIAMAESLRGVNADWKEISIKIARD